VLTRFESGEMSARPAADTSRPLNVLIVMPWDNPRGGVVSVVDNLARHLQARGHGVLFFHGGAVLLRDNVTTLGHAGVRLSLTMPGGGGVRGVLRTLTFPLLFTSGLLQLIWLLYSRRIEVINAHYPSDNYLYFAICRRLLPLRLVTSLHGGDAFYRERAKAAFSRAFKFVIATSDAVILPSHAYRQKFLEAFPDAGDRTTCIHNGIDTTLFRPLNGGREPIVRHRYILCVAELQEYKAIDVLLHAARPLLADDPSLTLVLAGDGPLRAELETLATSLGIRGQTMFLGTQGAPEIVRLLHGCHTLVLPSRMEPFGIALIEAMACKVPIVASRIGGIPEIVEHEVSGILVDPENPVALTAALRRVLDDDGLRKELARNGYSRVQERFRAVHTGTAYEDVFTSLTRIGVTAAELRTQ
jgi:glycosyltransferase involved in cell wall biosynthesis